MKVFLNTNPHRLQDPQYFRSIRLQMESATNSTPELIKYALKAFDIIFKEGFSYMKCGIELYNLIPESTVLQNMFSITNPKQN